MPGALRYADAVRMLGGNGPLLGALDRVVGGALTSATGCAPTAVLSFLGADAQLARLSRSLVMGAAERMHGLGRFRRTERLAAAHAVIVVAAYSEALARVRLPFGLREVSVSRTDSVRLATGDSPESRRLAAVADHLLRSRLPLPSLHEPYETTLTALHGFYSAMSGHVETYVSGLAFWDELSPETRQEARAALHQRIPRAAVAAYEEMFRQLAVDFPDVGVWADRVDHRATRVAVRHLEEAVTRLADGQLPTGRLAALRRAGSLPYDAPVLGDADPAAELTIPSLREAYVSPDFKVAGFGAADQLSGWSWWRGLEVRQALDEVGLGLTLTSYAALPDGDTHSCARLLLRLWSAGATFSAAHRDALWATGHAFNPVRTDFLKRYLAAVLRQWDMAGQPVHQEWIDRAHHLFDTHNTEAASPALATAFDVLVDERPHPQH